LAITSRALTSAPHVRAQLVAHEQFELVQVASRIIRGAINLHQTRGLSFYDALVVEAARVAGRYALCSEDLNPGEVIDGVKIVNPFTQSAAHAIHEP